MISNYSQVRATAAIRIGAWSTAGTAFIALSGMPIEFNKRLVISPILSLGYLTLLWLPVTVGYLSARQVAHTSTLPNTQDRETRNTLSTLLEGCLAGVFPGTSISVLIWLMATFDLREPLVNWSPYLLDFLTFGRSTIFGATAWCMLGALLGSAGGALHLAYQHTRRTLLTATSTVAAASMLELFLSDLLSGFGLSSAIESLYDKRGGVTIFGACTLAILSLLIYAVVVNAPRTSSYKRVALQFKQPQMNIASKAAIIVCLLIMPMLFGTFVNEVLANIGLFLLLALGLNIVVGLAGILDLGYVAFFAVGSYTTALLTAASSPAISPELPWFVAIFPVVAVAGIAGLVVGAPVIRMRGDYLAIVTLGFGEIIRILLLSDQLTGWFGGPQGITQIKGVEIFGLMTVSGVDPRGVFYLTLVFCLLAIYISWRLEHSKVGRAWMAVREDETVASTIGVNTAHAKLLAFIVGAIIGSFSGAILTAKVGAVFPSSFLILTSVITLVIVIFGGMGNITGVIVSSVILIGILGGPKQPGLLHEFSQFKLLIYGALLVCMMLAKPQGLIPRKRQSRQLTHEEVMQDAWIENRHQSNTSADTTQQHPPHTPEPTHNTHRAGHTPQVNYAHSPEPTAHTTQTQTPLLTTCDLEVDFGGVKALNDLNISIYKGEIVTLIGPNGAGKTTLFNAITSTLPTTSGEILFNGTSLTGLDPERITSLGIARTFQNIRLFNNMTVLENVMVAQHCHVSQNIFSTLLQTPSFKRTEKDVRSKAEDILSFFGSRLTGFRFEQLASTLSYANRRRLEIARAIATQPKLLLLDEPVAGMNPVETSELTSLIRQLRNKYDLTIVVIEHDMNVVREVSDRVIVLDHGHQIKQGSYSEVVSDPYVLDTYLGHGTDIRRTTGVTL